jgi:thymidine phosphorylase
MDEISMRRAIERKRDGGTLESSTWAGVVAAYVSGDIDDAQMAALAMACVWRGLDETEATALTQAMVASGATLRYPDGMFVVDKHSSGGVSDIVSLVAVPLVAACGVRVAKLSGRALGHTGGTIDKLEAIHGFNATPSI